MSPETINVIKSTAPFLAENGEELTRQFYRLLFENNPEVKPFFNASNQDGTQQRALAAAITGYAANIDNLDALAGAVALITEKHASLQVKAEHYPIVGANLLSAIRLLLKDQATEEIVGAWGEAYEFLAGIMIKTEEGIYARNLKKTGGWEGFKSFTVKKKVVESDVISSFYLSPSDGAPVPEFEAGQYITVRFPTEDGSTTMRNYSLSHCFDPDWVRISVKREPASSAGVKPGYVSNFLHDKITVGDNVEIAPPCGEFLLNPSTPETKPLVFLAGGVGITPVLSMIQTVLYRSPSQKITLIYAAIDEQHRAFHSEIEALQKQSSNFNVHYRYSGETPEKLADMKECSAGFVDEVFVQDHALNPEADYYFCGPKPFMIGIYQALVNNRISQSQINFEFFGPREEIEAVHA